MSHGKDGGGKRPGGKMPSKLGRKPPGSGKAKKSLNLDFSHTPKRTSLKKEAPAPAACPNQRLGEFVIDRLSHDGRGIAQWNGKTLFIERALPGERVSARFVSEHSRYAEAVTDQVIEGLADRQQPPCPYFSSCGGCQLQHMSLEMQLRFKQDAVLEQMQRWAGLVPKRVLEPIRSSSQGYRSRARLGTSYAADGSVTLGFRRGQSKELIHIEKCLVLVPALNHLLAPLTLWLSQLESERAVTHLELIHSLEGAAVIIRHVKRLTVNDRQALARLAEECQCQVWLQGDKNSTLTDLDGQACDPRLNYQLQLGNLPLADSPGEDSSLQTQSWLPGNSPLELAFHPQDFTQVNTQVNILMVQQALELLALKGTERVLDLFCGVGNFTLPIARHCAEVTGVEAIDAMVLRGRENAARLGLGNARFMAADLSKLGVSQLLQRCGKVDAILLDPPRDGAREILESIRQLAAARIVYVSCNPATLARDAKLLAESGYTLDSLGVLDMFPHTSHVESMALFVRR